MLARSHVVIGLCAWVAAAPALHLAPLQPVPLALAVAGALLPDIDHPKSWVGRRTWPVSTLLAAALGHRGLTHSALAAVAVVALLLHLGAPRAGVWAVAIGYLSHLAADMLTPRGLPLAWPLRGVWSVPLCRTGSPLEPLLVLALLGVTVWRALHDTGWLLRL